MTLTTATAARLTQRTAGPTWTWTNESLLPTGCPATVTSPTSISTESPASIAASITSRSVPRASLELGRGFLGLAQEFSLVESTTEVVIRVKLVDGHRNRLLGLSMVPLGGGRRRAGRRIAFIDGAERLEQGLPSWWRPRFANFGDFADSGIVILDDDRIRRGRRACAPLPLTK